MPEYEDETDEFEPTVSDDDEEGLDSGDLWDTDDEDDDDELDEGEELDEDEEDEV